MIRQLVQRERVDQRLRLVGQLDDFRAGREQRTYAFGYVWPLLAEGMYRQNDAPPAAEAHELLGKLGAQLEVDELRPRGDRIQQDLAPFLLASLERSTFPFRTAGHDDGPQPPFERADGIRPVNAVEADFDEVGAGRGIPRASQLLHRPSCDRHAKLRLAHLTPNPPQTKKPPQPVAGRLESMARAGSRASRQPPQRRRTTTNTTRLAGPAGRGASASKRCDLNKGWRAVSIFVVGQGFSPADRQP